MSAIIENYFKEYVGEKKSFFANHIHKLSNSGADSTELEYKYDGVYIYYHNRQTWCIDDYDSFTDVTVSVDGKIIYQMVKDKAIIEFK